MADHHDFQDRLKFSEGIQPGDAVTDAIMRMVPNASGIRKADQADDKNGTDFWIDRDHGLPSLSIDMKIRSFCPIEEYGVDDACIETTSVYVGGREPPYEDDKRRVVGWTRDLTKRTDYVCYTWPSRNNGVRYWILPFPALCAAANNHWRWWAQQYVERVAENDGYLTLSVYPHRHLIERAVREVMMGDTGNGPPFPGAGAPFGHLDQSELFNH